MTAILSQAELERHLWRAADILRRTVDSGDYKQYIFGLLFYRRLCDVWDEEFETLLAETGEREEAADPDEHRFHIPPQHHWNAVRKHATQIGQHLNNAFAAIEDANLRLRGVFGSVDFASQERFPEARLEKLLSTSKSTGSPALLAWQISHEPRVLEQLRASAQGGIMSAISSDTNAVLECVVVHELAHLKVRSHGQKFWTLLANLYPDYESQRGGLHAIKGGWMLPFSKGIWHIRVYPDVT